MLRSLLLLVALSLGGVSALVASPLGASAVAQRVAASPSMACNGGKGGRGGKSPSADKKRRGMLKRLLYAADSAENFNGIILSSQTESMLLKMNWKVRRHSKYHILKRAAQFDVAVPANFGGFDSPKQNTPGHKLSASITTQSPSNPAAVAALANLRAC